MRDKRKLRRIKNWKNERNNGGKRFRTRKKKLTVKEKLEKHKRSKLL